MRFMMLMIPSNYAAASPDTRPDVAGVERMMKYNEELAKSGALLGADGLHPPATAVRVTFPGGKAKLTDGPFAEAKEVLGGYWMIQVKSKEEAVEWARRIPGSEGDTVELRQVFEMSDFPEDVQKAADNPVVKEQIAKAQKK